MHLTELARERAALAEAVELVAELVRAGKIPAPSHARMMQLLAQLGDFGVHLGAIVRNATATRVERWEWERRARSLARQVLEHDAALDQSALPL